MSTTSEGPESAEEIARSAWTPEEIMRGAWTPDSSTPQARALRDPLDTIGYLPEPSTPAQYVPTREHERRLREIGAPWMPKGTVPEIVVEAIAAVAHEANRAYDLVCRGDASHLGWNETSPAQRTSVRAGVRSILTGEVRTAAESHARWLDYKRREGWTYGEVKDEAAKTHPCFRPYAELPYDQRRKDHLFFAIVRALATPHV